MQTEQLSEQTKKTIETLEGSDYELCTHSEGKNIRAGGSARLAVASGRCVPRGEFLFVSGANRYRLKVDGGVYKNSVFRDPGDGEENARRDSYFWPVRVLAIEEPEGSNAETLPVISGKLMPLKRGGSILTDQIAKFRAKDREPLGPWIPGDQFKVESRGLAYTVAVQRYLPPEHIPERSVLCRGGRYGKTWKTTPARTIPEVVMVRVLAVEPATLEATKLSAS